LRLFSGAKKEKQQAKQKTVERTDNAEDKKGLLYLNLQVLPTKAMFSKEYILGLVFIGLVAIIWAGSSVVTRILFTDSSFDSPFLLTCKSVLAKKPCYRSLHHIRL
jgi:hypothetical protein